MSSKRVCAHSEGWLGLGACVCVRVCGRHAHVVEVVPQQLVDDEESLSVVEAVEQQRQALLLLLAHLLRQELQQLHLCRAIKRRVKLLVSSASIVQHGNSETG